MMIWNRSLALEEFVAPGFGYLPGKTDAIRGATANDYPAYAVLSRELGDDPTPSAEQFAAELAPSILISERDGAPIGYVSYEKLAANGFIRNLVVAPGARGSGVGAALMTAAASQLRERGATDQWHLNVKTDNIVAIRFYERLGMRVQYRSVVLRMPWANLDRLPADDTRVTVTPLSDGEVGDVERALGILTGLLARFRARRGIVSLQLRDEQRAPVGVACFDPGFLGAFPFCHPSGVRGTAPAGARATRPPGRSRSTTRRRE